MKQHLFEGFDPALRDQLGEDAILVIGRNFGIGSSREHVVQALAGVGRARRRRPRASPASSSATASTSASPSSRRRRRRPRRGRARGSGSTPRRARSTSTGPATRAAPMPPLVGELQAAGGLVPWTARRVAAMIVRDAGDAWQVVLQTDHADLSGAFARAWAEQGPGHDVARDRRRAPRRRLGGLGAGAARRRGRQARQLPRRRRPLPPRLLPRGDRGDHGAGRRTPACSWRCTAQASTGSATGSTRASRCHALRRCRSWSTPSSPSRRRRSAASPGPAQDDYALLQLYDRLSLYFCMRDVEAGEAAELQGYRLEPLGPWRVRLSPYPFGESPATFSLVRRLFPKGAGGDVLGRAPERVRDHHRTLRRAHDRQGEGQRSRALVRDHRRGRAGRSRSTAPASATSTSRPRRPRSPSTSASIDYDMRGYGQSDRPVQHYDMEVWADDVAGLLDALEIDEAHVHGTSMGGMIAIVFAGKYPERTTSVVINCAAAKLGRSGRLVFKNWIDIAELDPDGPGQPDPRRADRVAGALAELPRDARGRRRDRHHPADPARLEPARGLHGRVPAMCDMDITGWLPKIHAPALVLGGDEDLMTPVGPGAERRRPGGDLRGDPGRREARHPRARTTRRSSTTPTSTCAW